MPRIFFERRDPGEDVRRWLGELDLSPSRRDQPPGECTPPVDVVEASGAIEVVVDLPGVAPESITLLFRAGVLLITGIKQPAGCAHRQAAFHLAERSFGRFARAIRFSGAVDASRAEAVLRAGELHVTIPRLDERRGADIRLTVQAG